MRRLIAVILCTFIAPARADVWATMENIAGGMIALTDEPSDRCKPDEKGAFATDADGKLIRGCWKIYNKQILLNFDGHERLYPVSSFDVDPDWKAKRQRSGGDAAPNTPSAKL